MIKKIMSLLGILSLAQVALASSPATIQLQGRLVNQNNIAVERNPVTFRVEVLSPVSVVSGGSGSNQCILYSETHEIDMRGSKGVFSISIGSGTSVTNIYTPDAVDSADAFLRVFSNEQTEKFSLACASGNSYRPSAGDLRLVRIRFNDGNGEQIVPKLHEIASVPYALHAASASKLGGLSKDNFAQLNTSVAPSAGQVLKWNGTKWEAAGDTIGITSESDPNVRAFAKTDLPICGVGQVLKSNGTSLSCVTDDTRAMPPDATTTSKGVVQIGSGLSVASGVVSVSTIPMSSVSGLQTALDGKVSHSQLPAVSCGANKVLTYISVTDTYACELIAIAGSQVTGNISGNAVGFTGSLGGDVNGTMSATSVVRIQGRPVAASAPANDQVLKWDGSQWVPSADTTGVLAESDPTVQTFAKSALPTCGAGEVLKSNGTSFTCVSDSVRTAPSDATTTSKGIVQIGSGLNVAAGVVSVGTINIANVSGLQSSLDGKVLKTQLPAVACGANQVMTYTSVNDNFTCQNIAIDGSQVSGNISGNAAGFTGSLAGDVTGTQSATVVAQIRGRPVATTAPTNSQVLKWDGSQWAPAADVTGVTVESDPNVQTFAKSALPTCGAGEVLKSDGTNLTCVSDATRATPADATTTSKGIVQIGSGLNVAAGVVSVGTIAVSNVSGLQTALDGKVSHSQLPSSGCGANKVLNYVSVTDTYTCVDIAIAGSQVSGNIAGNAAGFTGSLAGDVTGTQSATVVARLQGRPVSATAPTANQVLKWNGTAWAPAADVDTNSGGTVTSIAAGTGLTGGTITSTGTLAVDVGTTANKILQLNASAQIPAVSGALVTNLNGSQITTGTVDAARLGTGTANTTTFLRGDGQWVTAAANGGGRTTCPAGYTLIGTAGDTNAFCISTAERTATTWIGAVGACYGLTPKANLCSVQEWATACVAGTPSTMTDDYEWVSDFGYNGSNAITIGSGSCATANISAIGSSLPYRCCLK